MSIFHSSWLHSLWSPASRQRAGRSAARQLSLEALEDRNVPAAVGGTPTANFVDQVYRDILHRQADPTGLANWVQNIDSGQLSRQEVALSILGSEEGLRTQVNDLYLRFLNRPADTGGLNFWTQFLRDNDTTDLAAALIASPEYFQTQGGGTEAGFITAVYQDLLCRTPLTQEINDRSSDLDPFDAEDREDFAESVAESSEGRDMQVQLYFESYLRRNLDQRGRDALSDRLEDEDLDEAIDDDRVSDDIEDNEDAILISFLLASQEYIQLSQGTPTPLFATIPSCEPAGGLPAR